MTAVMTVAMTGVRGSATEWLDYGMVLLRWCFGARLMMASFLKRPILWLAVVVGACGGCHIIPWGLLVGFGFEMAF